MKQLLEKHPLILMEGAISERLRRAGHLRLQPDQLIAPLIYDQEGRAALQKLYCGYMEIAKAAQLPFVMLTPTWKANFERVSESGVDPDLNGDAVRFMKEVRDIYGAGNKEIKIGGLTGCRGDCYQPDEGLSAVEAERFHAWQIDQLALAGADFLIAQTLPNVEEAVGIAKAMEATGVPYIISFVINRDGVVLDGTDLLTAVNLIDSATQTRPVGFMVNCSYPAFLKAAQQPEALFLRLIGYQANASSLDHADLDGAQQLHVDDVEAWGDEMLLLNHNHGVKILGGCCGTGVTHLGYLVDHMHAQH